MHDMKNRGSTILLVEHSEDDAFIGLSTGNALPLAPSCKLIPKAFTYGQRAR